MFNQKKSKLMQTKGQLMKSLNTAFSFAPPSILSLTIYKTHSFYIGTVYHSSCAYAITFTVSSDKNSSSLPDNGMHALQIIPFPFHKKAPTCSLSNMQGLSCHILSSVIFAHRVPDNLFFFFLFRCNFCCCFCMFFAIANNHKCHAEYY